MITWRLKPENDYFLYQALVNGKVVKEHIVKKIDGSWAYWSDDIEKWEISHNYHFLVNMLKLYVPFERAEKLKRILLYSE